MNLFHEFKKALRLIEKVFCFVGVCLFLGLMVLGSLDVIGRYIFNNPITGAIEISQVLMATMIFLAWPYTQNVKSHIAFEIIVDNYPSRIRKAVKLMTLVLSFILIGSIVWQSSIETLWHWRECRTFQTIPLPIAPFEYSVTIGGIILCAELLIDIFHLFSKSEP
jgi:TRAP-type C4-dicarboxylate transport system permease small subunit